MLRALADLRGAHGVSPSYFTRRPPQLSRPGHHASHPRRTPAARVDCRQAAGALTSTASLARAAARARLCLSRSELKAPLRSLTPKRPTSLAASPANLANRIQQPLRYWNIARQRHCYPSARCCAALHVSADRAAQHSPQTGGKPGLCHERRRNTERDGLSAGGKRIRTISTAEVVLTIRP